MDTHGKAYIWAALLRTHSQTHPILPSSLHIWTHVHPAHKHTEKLYGPEPSFAWICMRCRMGIIYSWAIATCRFQTDRAVCRPSPWQNENTGFASGQSVACISSKWVQSQPRHAIQNTQEQKSYLNEPWKQRTIYLHKGPHCYYFKPHLKKKLSAVPDFIFAVSFEKYNIFAHKENHDFRQYSINNEEYIYVFFHWTDEEPHQR